MNSSHLMEVAAMADFAEYLKVFLTEYLPLQKGASECTVKSYRDTFKLFVMYHNDVLGIQPHKIELSKCTVECITEFLSWIETVRQCCTSTRNQRLAAIRSFFKFVQFEKPESIAEFQRIAAIPHKKHPQIVVPYLTSDGMKALLSVPDRSTVKGRRDLTLLSLLYDSGCRVQELINLKVMDISLFPQGIVTLHGKGGKIRRVPLMSNMTDLIKSYLSENNMNDNSKSFCNVFVNSHNEPLTKEGVAYIISKYVSKAKSIEPTIPDKVTPHMFRHSKAMHMLQAGINLIYIRDFLGHSDLKTTTIYAKSDIEIKRKVIEQNIVNLLPEQASIKDWRDNANLMEWLTSL